MSEAWRGGSTRQWRRIRAEVMEHNRIHYGGKCRAQVIGVCIQVAEHAHHTLGRNVTGDDPRFIEGVCGPCNIHIGDPQVHPRDCRKCVNNAWVLKDPVPIQRTKW